MVFLKRIATELVNEDGSTTRYELQADPISGCLTFRRSEFDGKQVNTLVSSVRVRALDPRLVEVTDPDSNGVRHLRVVCALYRDAVGGTLEPGHSPLLQRSVSLLLPLSGEVPDAQEIVNSFREFLATCDAKSPTVHSSGIEDLLARLREALSPASGLRVPSGDGKVIYEQKTILDEQNLCLVRELQRPRFSPERWTFELLSLDVAGISCLRVPDGSAPEGWEFWGVTLPSVERLGTTAWQVRPKNEVRMWYTSVLFPSESVGRRFAIACAECVRQLRERLYHANYEV